MTVKTRDKTEAKHLVTPAKLATPTDLSKEQSQAITGALNPLIADAFALYVKYKNFHWHLSGSHFRSYHLLFDEHAEQVLASIDLLAERVRRVGGTTLHSIGHIAQLQTIQDNNEEYVPTPEMFRNLIDDENHIAQNQRAAIEVCEQNKDSVSANVLQEILALTEKRKWFLFETLQDDRTK